MPLPDPALQAALREWLELADGDLDAAERLAAVPRHYRRVGFNCPQAIEKFCKGALTAADIPFTKTHDLLQLMSALHPVIQFGPDELAAAAALVPFAVRWRYPQDTDPDELPVGELLAIAQWLRNRLEPLVLAVLL